jgi:trimeric autotransporter adhesin
MKTISKVLVGAVLVLSLAGCADIALRDIIAQQVALANAPAIRVGSIADSRFNNGGWTLDGAQMVDSRAKLLNPANFGAAGTVKKTIIITDLAATITPVILSQFDVFFMGYMPNSFGAGEITAMMNWVNGGGVMIVTADDQFDNQLAAAIGYSMPSGSKPPGTTAPNGAGTTHPVFVGPFGTVSSIVGAGSQGYFFGNPAGQVALGYDAGNGIFTVFEVTYGSGRFLVCSDVDFFDTGLTAGGTINPGNGDEVFLGNVFAYEHR